MAGGERKGYNQKLKMLYLEKIFKEETDDRHALTMPEIIERLQAYGVNADRKTLYLDFDELRRFGMDILADHVGHQCYYHLGRRDFELPELKLLVDAVQSAKFITERKSNELIRRLETLTSRYEAKQLQRQVFTSGRVKTMNRSVLVNVDAIHEAINTNRQIRFKYAQWNLKKELIPRRNGKWYQISPWALLWSSENYYLVAYDAEEDMIKHFRVDKMLRPAVTGEKRLGQALYRESDLPRYATGLFDMNTGEETAVTLEVDNRYIGIILDRFGRDIMIMPTDDSHFRTVVNVTVSSPFLGWVLSLGEYARIISPESVVREMSLEVRQVAEMYPGE